MRPALTGLCHCLLLLIASSASISHSLELNVYGDAQLRYENDFGLNRLDHRERLRFTGHLGINSRFNRNWMADAQLSTGLKDKQNVPTITIHRFSSGSNPDRDVFLDRAYLRYRDSWLHAVGGKIAWSLPTNTPMFWDRDLSPYGLHASYDWRGTRLHAAVIKPLDGESATVGTLSYLGATWKHEAGAVTFSVLPWFAHFQSEGDAQFATADTGIDHRSLRVATSLAYRDFKLGLDWGRATGGVPGNVDLRDQKVAWTAQLQYGGLTVPGSYLAFLRVMHVGRFGVITEFADNAAQRFATSNIEGFDVLVRRQMTRNWWLGARYSRIETIAGEFEEGQRFRLEARYSFGKRY